MVKINESFNVKGEKMQWFNGNLKIDSIHMLK